MNIACWFYERALARRTADDSRDSGFLSQHPKRCLRCAAIQSAYESLSRRLAYLAEPASNASRITAGVMTRIESVRPEAAWSGIRSKFALSGAIASFVVAVVMLSQSRHSLNETAAVILPRAITKPVRLAAASPKGVSKRIGIWVRPASWTRKAPAVRRRIPVRRMILAKSPEMKMNTFDPAPSTPVVLNVPAKTPAVAEVSWAGVGAWYERSGNTPAALAAYCRAFEEQPSPTLAYKVGTVAESAGDISTAVDYYARALEPIAHEEQKPPKGSTTCIETPSSA